MEISIPTLLRIKPDCIGNLGRYLKTEKFLKIAFFYGEGIKELFHETLSTSLDSQRIQVIAEKVVRDNDIDSIMKTAYGLPSGVDAIVAMGGGKAIDYCKYMAFILQIPVISIPTAISNDGFSSPVSSLIVNGKRKTLKAKIPYGVIIDTAVIKKSPQLFTYSGIGDMISKYTAIFDWKLSFHKTGEFVNDFAVLVATNSIQNIVNFGSKDISDLEFLKLLGGSLVLSGISMEVCQSSRPASGSEHLISHAYDKIAAKPTLHGLQVGVSTYAISLLQKNPYSETIKNLLEETGFFSYMREHPLNKKEYIEAVKYAPNVKENFYTILSEKGMVEALVNFVERDEFFNGFVV